MSFFKTENIEEGKKRDGNVSFLRLTSGFHIVRFVGEPRTAYVHYIPSSKITVGCNTDNGEKCAICEHNMSIMSSYPSDYRERSGFYNRNLRYFVNVLDRTPVKVCPKCKYENKPVALDRFLPACESCGVMILDVKPEPSNKIKILSISYGNARDLDEKLITTSALLGKSEPLDPRKFDVLILVTGSGKGKKISFNLLTDKNDDISVLGEEFIKPFDLNDAVIKLTYDETLDLLNGATLRDIFLARRKSFESDVAVNEKEAETAEALVGKMTNDLEDELARKSLEDLIAEIYNS